MGLQLQIDAAGCRGALVQYEPGPLPSLDTVGRWVVTLLLPGATWMAIRVPRAGFAVLAVLLLITLVLVFARDGGLEEWLVWEGAERPVTRHFEVRNGVLTVTGPRGRQTAPLADARITRFEDGLQVNPALGRAVQLTWSDATPADIDRLAALLETETQHRLDERGTRRDIPEDLEGLRR